MHCHPTVRIWARDLLSGKGIPGYQGDPLLDFSISNFLDRIAYKDPKSKEKLAKFSKSQRMANIERPINDFDFSKGEGPEVKRAEEEFMYKYLQKRPKLDKGNDDGEGSDVSEFAEQAIEKKMKELNGGEDDFDETDEDMGSMNDDGKEPAASGSDEDLFGDQEDLQSVNFDDGQEEGEEEEEEFEYGAENANGNGGFDYDDEYDEEIEEQEVADNKKKDKKDKKKDPKDSGFAAYEDFAHLLEEGAEEQTKKKTFKKRDNKF